MSENFEIRVIYKEKCKYCRCIVAKDVRQQCYSNDNGSWGVEWEVGYICDCCGTAYELSFFKNTPKYIRDALIKEYGLWLLNIGEATENREEFLASFLKLRRRINFTVLRQLPPLNGTIAEGTLAEMKCLQLNFENVGIVSQISQKLKTNS